MVRRQKTSNAFTGIIVQIPVMVFIQQYGCLSTVMKRDFVQRVHRRIFTKGTATNCLTIIKKNHLNQITVIKTQMMYGAIITGIYLTHVLVTLHM
jgi:hypothetical protein